MALQVKKGTWTGSGATPQAVTGVGFTPKALIAWGTGAGASGLVSSSSLLSLGFGTRRGDVTQSRCIGLANLDDVGTSDASRTWNTTLLNVLSSPAINSYSVSLVSFDADGFTVSYVSPANATGHIFHYLAIGGADITDANVLEDDWPTTGATFTVVGMGFQPDVLFFLAGVPTTLAAASFAVHALIGFGVAASSTAEWGISTTADDGATMASALNWNGYANGSCLALLTPDADTLDARADLASFDADGATLTNVDAPAGAQRVFALGLKGGQWAADIEPKATAVGDDTYDWTTPTFTPKAVLMARSRATALNSVTLNAFGLGIGGGSSTDGTQEGAATFSGVEAINTQVDRVQHTDSILAGLSTANPPVLNARADLTQLNSLNFVINWASNDAIAHQVGFLAMGDSPPAPSGHPAYSRHREVPGSAARPNFLSALLPRVKEVARALVAA